MFKNKILLRVIGNVEWISVWRLWRRRWRVFLEDVDDTGFAKQQFALLHVRMWNFHFWLWHIVLVQQGWINVVGNAQNYILIVGIERENLWLWYFRHVLSVPDNLVLP